MFNGSSHCPLLQLCALSGHGEWAQPEGEGSQRICCLIMNEAPFGARAIHYILPSSLLLSPGGSERSRYLSKVTQPAGARAAKSASFVGLRGLGFGPLVPSLVSQLLAGPAARAFQGGQACLGPAGPWPGTDLTLSLTPTRPTLGLHWQRQAECFHFSFPGRQLRHLQFLLRS